MTWKEHLHNQHGNVQKVTGNPSNQNLWTEWTGIKIIQFVANGQRKSLTPRRQIRIKPYLVHYGVNNWLI